MQLGMVCGTVVATLKHAALAGKKLLLVQPLDLDGRPRGRVVAAVDVVDAGPGDRVLLHDEGSGASQVLARSRGPVRTLVIGVVDQVTVEPSPTSPTGAPTEDGTRG